MRQLVGKSLSPTSWLRWLNFLFSILINLEFLWSTFLCNCVIFSVCVKNPILMVPLIQKPTKIISLILFFSSLPVLKKIGILGQLVTNELELCSRLLLPSKVDSDLGLGKAIYRLLWCPTSRFFPSQFYTLDSTVQQGSSMIYVSPWWRWCEGAGFPKVYSAQSTVNSEQCTVHRVQWTVNSVQCT